MSAYPEFHNQSKGALHPQPMACPEDVDWIFDVDTLDSAGGEGFRRLHRLLAPHADCPHHPFLLASDSASLWDQTVRNLSMAAGEANILLRAETNEESPPVFYARVAGFREGGLPRIACVFQRIENGFNATTDDCVWRNWLYLLHEIKNTISLLRVAEDPETASTPATQPEVDHLRHFAIHCLENHIRNGILLASDESRDLPNNPLPMDLRPTLEAIIDAHSVALGQNDNAVQLSFDCQSLTTVRLDRTLFEQLFNNLLLNKAKLLHHDTVRIKVMESRDAQQALRLTFLIEDNGPAFPDFILNNEATKADISGLLDVRRGSGLGLSIVRRIIRTMGGEIAFFNDAEVRRIRIHLPVR
jgi:hypothetical protein